MRSETGARPLENHHLDNWVDTGTTTLEGVVRICKWEHYLLTPCGYTLEPRGDGTYDLIPPDDRGPP